jgi:selenocysteine-specific elongation factor
VHVIGTAGHVDHGKSALINALTGTNPDRWLEERLRGMTLDLGFAHLRFDDGIEGSIVDVPGHERFLHNMLAGAAGMELLLLVVDANEGVMPQTLEHLQILQFLNVLRVIVVANKIDLIERELRERVLRRIAGELEGTIAADAPIVAVSATTGENLDELRRMLHDELAALPPPNRNAPVYLPIDRAFVLSGLGTVVTGTLMQGSIATGETLVLEPGGKAVHVRSIGVFESTQPRVEAGSRVALNLPGLDHREVARGQAIVGREFAALRTFAVRFLPLRGAPPLGRRRTPVRAYFGSAEILGTLVIADGSGSGEEVRAQLQLREPVVVFPGLRFVLRRPSPMTLLGGGYVEGVEAAAPLEHVDPDEAAVLAQLHEAGLDAVELGSIARSANLREDAARAALDRLVEREAAIRVARPPAYVDAAAADALLASVLDRLDEAHRSEPWAMGMTSIALSRLLALPEALLVRVAEHFVETGRLIHRGGYYAAVAHRPALTPEQTAFFERIVTIDAAQPFLPIPFAGVAAALKGAQLPGVTRAFETLLARGTLVRVADDLYRGSQIDAIRARVEAHFGKVDRMTASQFRDLLGTSRKYAVPMLEWLDAHAITIRSGDYRTLRKKSGATGGKPAGA